MKKLIIQIEKKDKFNTKKLYESFYEILIYSNYDILKCYKVLNNYKDNKGNIGIIISIIFLCIYLICLLFYIIFRINPLKKKLRMELKKEKIKNINQSKFDYNYLLYPPVKKKSSTKSTFKRTKNNNLKIYLSI